MQLKTERVLDALGVKILKLLQANARMAFSEIGRKVGVSSPAVAERVCKMEEAGIINGYHAQIDPLKIGLPVTAYIHLSSGPEKSAKFLAFAENALEIMECSCITGSASFMLHVMTRSVSHLDMLVEKLERFGPTRSSIVLRTPVKKKQIEIVEPEREKNHGG